MSTHPAIEMNLTTGLQSEAIKASLAEMDRKLRELQQELEIAPRSLQGSQGAVFAAPPTPVPAPGPSLRPAVVPGVTAPVGLPGSPEAIVDEAHSVARQILDNAVVQLGAVKNQIDQLLHLRDFLAESVRTLLSDCEQGLTQIESDLPPGILESAIPPKPAAPVAQVAPVVDPTFAPAPLAAPIPAAVAPPAQPPLAPAAMSAMMPISTPIAPSVPGKVKLVAGPFRDIAAVGALEQSLAHVVQVDRVHVLGFEESNAVMELTLNAPVDLLPELRRTLPFQFEPTHQDAANLLLRIVEHAEPLQPGPVNAA